MIAIKNDIRQSDVSIHSELFINSQVGVVKNCIVLNVPITKKTDIAYAMLQSLANPALRMAAIWKGADRQ